MTRKSEKHQSKHRGSREVMSLIISVTEISLSIDSVKTEPRVQSDLVL